MPRTIAVPLLAVALLTPPPLRAASPPPATSDVFLAGHGGVHTHRIPATALSPSGVVAVFREAREEER